MQVQVLPAAGTLLSVVCVGYKNEICMEIEVQGCTECPFNYDGFSCTVSSSADVLNREGEYPDNCPLLQAEITVKLKRDE